MRRVGLLFLVIGLIGCGGAQPSSAGGGAPKAINDGDSGAPVSGQDDFGLREGDAKSAGGVSGSKLKPTATEAVLKLIVQDNHQQPIPKVVVKVVGGGQTLYSPETDATGFAELLVPAGNEFKLTYLSLFEDPVEKSTVVPDEPNVTMALTLTWTPPVEPPPLESPDEGLLVERPASPAPRLILKGVVFDTAKATLKPESFPHLEKLVEFLLHKPSAMIELSGHTDNRGDPKKNLVLSEKRANAVRNYLISKGIEGDRIVAVGYGDTQPIATNDTEQGRQLNRRTEAKEIGVD